MNRNPLNKVYKIKIPHSLGALFGSTDWSNKSLRHRSYGVDDHPIYPKMGKNIIQKYIVYKFTL